MFIFNIKNVVKETSYYPNETVLVLSPRDKQTSRYRITLNKKLQLELPKNDEGEYVISFAENPITNELYMFSQHNLVNDSARIYKTFDKLSSKDVYTKIINVFLLNENNTNIILATRKEEPALGTHAFILSVLKESYEKDGFILRLFNPGKRLVKLNLNNKNIKNAFLTNLYEKVLEEISGEIVINPKGYTTIKIIL